MNTNNTNSKTDWSKRDVGALWKREGKNQKYLSGYVKVDESGSQKEVKIVVFSNKNKNNNEKAPDYRIYISEQTTQNANQSQVKSNVEAKSFVKKQKTVDVNEEEDLL